MEELLDFSAHDLSVILPSFAEAWADVRDVSLTGQALFLAAVLWIALLAVPLSGVDRRDLMTGATYVGFLLGAGFCVFVMLPGSLGLGDRVADYLLLSVLLAGAGIWRWRGRRRDLLTIVAVKQAANIDARVADNNSQAFILAAVRRQSVERK